MGNLHQNKREDTPQYRMVAFDLDGTLLQPNHQLSQQTIDYIRYLHNRGFIISFATGRMAACTFDQILDLQLSFPTEYLPHKGLPVISSNGARGAYIEPISSNDFQSRSTQMSHSSNQTHHNHQELIVHESHYLGEGRKEYLHVYEEFLQALSTDVAQKVISIVAEMPHFVQYYVGNDIYAAPKTNSHLEFMRDYAKAAGVTQKICDGSFKEAFEHGPASKILIICGEEHVDNVMESISKSLDKSEAHIVRGSPPWFIEILNPKVCKGYGLQRMSEIMNVDLKEIIAFGDGDNDLEFLQFAGRGIAMKNARKNVKAVADEVTKWTNSEEGVIRTLKNMEKKGLLYFPTL